jgi:hypothetical protein
MKTPTYLMQQNKLLSNNINMQDKVYSLKSFVNTKCTETSRKLNFLSTTNNSVDKNNLLWAEEYNVLLTELMDDILETKLPQEQRDEYLFHRIAKKDPVVKKRLVSYEID